MNRPGSAWFAVALWTLVVLSFTLPWVAGCGGDSDGSSRSTGSASVTAPAKGSLLAQIRERGSLIVGTAITKPFLFHDPRTNDLMGLDVDVASAIATRLGVKVEWREMPFASLIPALQTGKLDMTIGAMHITDERRGAVDFASPYLDTGLVMVTRPEEAKRFRKAEDVGGARVGVKIGATGDQLAQDLITRGVKLERKEYKETLESLLDLEIGRIDVVFNDFLNTLAYRKERPSKIEIVKDAEGQVLFLSRAGLGMAVRKGCPDLLGPIDDALRKMKADGTIQKLYGKWLEASR